MQLLPFRTEILLTELDSNTKDLLPATYRSRDDLILIPQPSLEFLEHDLSQKKIEQLRPWLWLCGLPNPAHSLSYQTLHQRKIIPTEDVRLHLLWSPTGIFIKPLPLYLLSLRFWKDYILPNHSEINEHEGIQNIKHDQFHQEHFEQENKQKEYLTKCSLGFLFSYVSLIASKNDFCTAMNLGLLPKDITWPKWQLFTKEFIHNYSKSQVSIRYNYGELRLHRINRAYQFYTGNFLRDYSSVDASRSYYEYITHHFTILAAALAYSVIVLQAMQVGLATEKLSSNQVFHNACYGFSIFAIVAPLVLATAVIVILLVVVFFNWFLTKQVHKQKETDLFY